MKKSIEQKSPTSALVAESVLRCVESGGWRAYTGESLVQLQQWLQRELVRDHVRLCSSGTFAVELALRSLHLKPSDEVILCSYDYPGNFRAIDDAGAKVVLCDPNSNQGWSLTVDVLEQCVAPETKAVVVSHLHGECAPMDQIMEWARDREIKIIEDACQVHGASLHGIPLGGWGDIGVFSYGGSKLITAGRGGAVVTSHEILAQRMKLYCERGNDAYPLAEIQAATVLPQCQRLTEDHTQRAGAAKLLIDGLRQFEWLELPNSLPHYSAAFYKLGMRIREGFRDRMEREELLSALHSQGVEIGEGFMGFANRSPKRFRTPHSLNRARELASTTMVLHHSHLLSPDSGETTVGKVLEAFQHAHRDILH